MSRMVPATPDGYHELDQLNSRTAFSGALRRYAGWSLLASVQTANGSPLPRSKMASTTSPCSSFSPTSSLSSRKMRRATGTLPVALRTARESSWYSVSARRLPARAPGTKKRLNGRSGSPMPNFLRSVSVIFRTVSDPSSTCWSMVSSFSCRFAASFADRGLTTAYTLVGGAASALRGAGPVCARRHVALARPRHRDDLHARDALWQPTQVDRRAAAPHLHTLAVEVDARGAQLLPAGHAHVQREPAAAHTGRRRAQPQRLHRPRGRHGA